MNGEMSYKQGKYSKLIDRFADSGYKICEVTFGKDEKGGKEDATIVYCMNQAAKRFSKPHIHAIRRNDKIYLVNTMLSR